MIIEKIGIKKGSFSGVEGVSLTWVAGALNRFDKALLRCTKLILIISTLICLVNSIQAQSISPRVFPTQGSYAPGVNMGLTWTLGETYTQSMSGGGVGLTLGFEQPGMILPPVAPAAQTVCSDTTYTFVFDNVMAGAGGNEIEWATHSSFDSSTILSSPGNISLSVYPGFTDTIWIRSRVSATGDVSSAIMTEAINNVYPSIPTAPSAQTVCSDTSYTFVFDSVTAGAGADEIEWSTGSNFIFANIISSPGNISVSTISGTSGTLWIRSMLSTTGCVSSAVTTLVTNNANPSPPMTPNTQTFCGDTMHTFVFDSVIANIGADEIEWATNSAFASATIDSSPGNISLTVNSGSTDTIWIKSIVSETGCISSGASVSTAINNVNPSPPTAPAPQVVSDDSVYIFGFDSIVTGSGGDELEWALNRNFDSSFIAYPPAYINVSVGGNQIDTIYIRSRGFESGCISSSVFTTATNKPQPLAPVAPSPQSACSDTGYTFVFDSVIAGTGGNQIEWATNISFSDSVVLSLPATITITVQSDTVLWLRSRDSVTGRTSAPVATTAQVNTLPATASLNTFDTIACPGNQAVINVFSSDTDLFYTLYVNGTPVDSSMGTDTTLGLFTPGINTASTFYVKVADPSTQCRPSTSTIGNIYLPVLTFTGGDTVLGFGDSSCYVATIMDSFRLRYNILWGGATIDSISGCVSNNVTGDFVVQCTASNSSCSVINAYQNVWYINPPEVPLAQDSISDTIVTFTFDSIFAGIGGDQIEWSTDSTFSTSTIVTSPATISINLDTNSAITIWIRSRNSANSTVSRSVNTSANNDGNSRSVDNYIEIVNYGTLPLTGSNQGCNPTNIFAVSECPTYGLELFASDGTEITSDWEDPNGNVPSYWTVTFTYSSGVTSPPQTGSFNSLFSFIGSEEELVFTMAEIGYCDVTITYYDSETGMTYNFSPCPLLLYVLPIPTGGSSDCTYEKSAGEATYGFTLNQTTGCACDQFCMALTPYCYTPSGVYPVALLDQMSWSFDGGTAQPVGNNGSNDNCFIPSVLGWTTGTHTVELLYSEPVCHEYTESSTETVTIVAPSTDFTPSVNCADVFFSGTSNCVDNDISSGWSWTFGDGASGTGQYVGHTYAISGTHTVTLTVTDYCGNAHTASQIVTITIPSASITSSPSPPSICPGNSATLTASGAGTGGTYAWSNMATTAAITESPSSSTSYDVTVTNAENCTATASQTITVLPLPAPDITGPSAVCSGESATLSVSNGPFATYQWNYDGSTSSSIDPVTTTITTTTVTYTVTVSDGSGCFGTTSTDVTVYANPTVSISPSATTLCSEDEVTLTASGGVNYSWSYDNNTKTSTSNPLTDYPTSDETYTVTATDDHGCKGTKSIDITVATPVISINQTTGPECDSYILTASASVGTGFTYSWSPGGATTSAIPISSSGEYTVTVKNNYNCSAVASINIPYISIDCQCYSNDFIGDVGLSFGPSVSASQLNTLFGSNVLGPTTKNIAFNGTFTIDENFTISNCSNITFAPGSIIKIKPHVTLTINNSVLQACDELWYGIQMDPGGTSTLVFNNSYIGEALYGVETYSGSTVSIEGNTFDKCFIGFYFNTNNDAGSLSLNLPMPFTANSFICNGALPPAPEGMNTDYTAFGNMPSISQVYANPNPKTWAGVYLYGLTNFSLNSCNFGQTTLGEIGIGIANGIMAFFTNLKISYCKFKNIQPYNYYTLNGLGQSQILTTASLPVIRNLPDAATSDIAGNGIWLLGSGSQELYETGLNGLDFSLVNFRNCYNGIVTSNAQTYITENTMDILEDDGLTQNLNNQCGISVQNLNPIAGIVKIEYNNITYSNRGIKLDELRSFVSVYVYQNTVNIYGASDLNEAIGVDVEDCFSAPWGPATYNKNTITVYSLGAEGMYFNNTSQANIINNTVMLADPYINWDGINISYCQNIYDAGNYVYSSGPTQNYYSSLPTGNPGYPAGIRYFAVSNSIHQCNSTEDIYTGMWFSETSNNVTVQGNQFNPNESVLSGYARMNNGLVVDATATTLPQQIDQGNEWFEATYADDDPTYSVKPAANLNSSPIIKEHEAFGIAPADVPCTGCGNQYWPLHVTSGWFVPSDEGVDYTCSSPPLPIGSIQPCNDCNVLTGVDQGIINGELEYNAYGNELQWDNERTVYEKLQLYPALIDSAANADSFYVAKQSSAMGALVAVENARQAAMQPDSATWAALSAQWSNVDSLNQLLVRLDSIRSSYYGLVELTDVLQLIEGDSTSEDTLADTLVNYYGQMLTIQGQVNTITTSADSVVMAFKMVKDSLITGVLTSNAAITPTNTIESNRVLLNDVYLSTVALDSAVFDSTRLSQLYYLAWQCPYTGGDAVYAARGLLALIKDTFYIDEALCDTSSLRSLAVHQPDTIQQLNVRLFPNPAMDYAILQLSTTTTGEMQLQITDGLGQKVFDQNIGFTNTQYIINTSLFSSGLYYVNLYNSGSKIFGGKLDVLLK